MVNLKKHLDLLGMQVTDRVTAFEGVVASVCFDLYGCIQAIVTPKADKDGKLPDSRYFDVSRLDVTGTEPVMKRPEFDWTPEKVSAGEHGPADRPSATPV